MEKEDKYNQIILRPPAESEFFLQWGNRKRLRCVRVRGANTTQVSSDPSSTPSRVSRSITSSRFLALSHKDVPATRFTRKSETGTLRSEIRKSLLCGTAAVEKDEKFYSTRGSKAEERGKGRGVGSDEENEKKMAWPKLCISLTSKEKEEDFMAMKGCRLPQRPKKRAKVIQRTLLLVSPGAWLTDMSVERYEVREKKSGKKQRRRGLKGMGGSCSSSVDTDCSE